MKNPLRILLPLVLVCLPSVVFGHPGHTHGENALTSGLLHPLTGLDHLLAMLAVGLWAGRLGRTAVFAVPASFVVAMLIGGALAVRGVEFPYIEQGIAVSVLLLGLAIAFAVRLPVVVPCLFVAAFALFHGAAHGMEMPFEFSPWVFAAGFGISTIFLHAIGIGAAGLTGRFAPEPVVRVAGAVIALAGVLFLL